MHCRIHTLPLSPQPITTSHHQLPLCTLLATPLHNTILCPTAGTTYYTRYNTHIITTPLLNWLHIITPLHTSKPLCYTSPLRYTHPHHSTPTLASHHHSATHTTIRYTPPLCYPPPLHSTPLLHSATHHHTATHTHTTPLLHMATPRQLSSRVGTKFDLTL